MKPWWPRASYLTRHPRPLDDSSLSETHRTPPQRLLLMTTVITYVYWSQSITILIYRLPQSHGDMMDNKDNDDDTDRMNAVKRVKPLEKKQRKKQNKKQWWWHRPHERSQKGKATCASPSVDLQHRGSGISCPWCGTSPAHWLKHSWWSMVQITMLRISVAEVGKKYLQHTAQPKLFSSS